MDIFKFALSRTPLKLLSLCVPLITFTSCQDDSFQEFNSIQHESEVSTTGVVVVQQHGDIIEGEYIVMLNAESGEVKRSVSSRSEIERKKDLTAFSHEMIKDFRLKEEQIKSVLVSQKHPGLLLTDVSEDIVIKFGRDERVSTIEPNTVIAMSLGNQLSEQSILDPTFRSILVPADDKTLKKESKEFLKEIGGWKNMKNSSKRAWIIDSGIDLDHEDLNVNTTLSRSFVDNESSPDDGFGHGTHVAGIIGAKNNGKGITGVAAGIELVAIKVLDSEGYGTKYNLVQAVEYVKNKLGNGDVVNISLSTGVSESVDEEAEDIAEEGILTVAAGNYGENINNYSPARVKESNIYVVGALDENNQFASYSNYGSYSRFYLARGTGIYSTFKDNQYAVLSGTSMAAPIVAGILLIDKAANLDYSELISTPSGPKSKLKRK